MKMKIRHSDLVKNNTSVDRQWLSVNTAFDLSTEVFVICSYLFCNEKSCRTLVQKLLRKIITPIWAGAPRSFHFLKVVSATFVLVYFLSLKESTCQTRKNVFYFTSKALFVLKKIKF